MYKEMNDVGIMDKYLSETYYFDYKHPSIQAFVAEFLGEKMSDKEKAIQLYLKVRDGWHYNPYRISFRTADYKASNIMQNPTGHCIDKAILYITGLRALGIPSRLHLACVTNHIAVEKLVEKFGTNRLTPHGSVGVFLSGKWVKATPAFNKELCVKCNVAPLEFNGKDDSLFQEYSKSGGKFMEYLEDYGHFDDFPEEFVKQNMKENYPKVEESLGEGFEIIR